MIHCDIRTCVGCRTCEVVCGSAHFGAVSPALSRIRVAKLEETGLDLAIACLSCLEKPCLDCPQGALSAGPRGDIRLDARLCDACGVCVEACPIGAVGFYEDKPLFCDLCDGTPACVTACPSGALSYREAFRDMPLVASLQAGGSPGEKRARFGRERGEPLRESWRLGRRVDS